MPPFYSHSKLRLLKDNFDFSKKKEQNSPSVICLPANRLTVFLSLRITITIQIASLLWNRGVWVSPEKAVFHLFKENRSLKKRNSLNSFLPGPGTPTSPGLFGLFCCSSWQFLRWRLRHIRLQTLGWQAGRGRLKPRWIPPTPQETRFMGQSPSIHRASRNGLFQ